jgi:rSAM/selenodomain-associated transferase 1
MSESGHPFRVLSPLLRNAAFAGRCALTVMAKAPRPGKVKTRLSPPLTPAQASALNALEAPAELVISFTPQGEEAAFCGVLGEGTLLLPQRGDSFGERLLATAEDLFTCGFAGVCLIDSDSPTVPTAEFIRAAKELLRPGQRAVLGPSADGGYYLIGLQRPVSRVFEGIAWSTSAVTKETLERAAEIELPVQMLKQWYDVDDVSSLGRLYAELIAEGSHEQDGFPAPHTREYLAQIQELPFSIAPEVEAAR